MSGLAIAALVVSILAALHSIVFGMVARWHAKRSYVVTHGEGVTLLERLNDGLAKEAAMRANPPWYVRYVDWLNRRGR
jgi:hypothetical protein